MENTSEFIEELRSTIVNWKSDAARYEMQGNADRAVQIRQWVTEAEGVIALYNRFFDANRVENFYTTTTMPI